MSAKAAPAVAVRPRRSLLYVPGNSAALVKGAGLFSPDVLVYDLEDAVALAEKDAARLLVREALQAAPLCNPHGCERMVRINGLETPFWADDLACVMPAGPDAIRLPKVESPEQVVQLAEALARAEKEHRLPRGRTQIVAILETVRGVARVEAIAAAHPRLTALTLGAEDFTRDLGTSRSRGGEELMHARGRLVLAARDAGLQAIDTVFSDVNDDEGLLAETRRVKQLGFDGKSVIHPRQIRLVHHVFDPSADEIEHAQRVVAAADKARREGAGVVALDGRMVDTPVVKKAERILRLAQRLGLAAAGGEATGATGEEMPR